MDTTDEPNTLYRVVEDGQTIETGSLEGFGTPEEFAEALRDLKRTPTSEVYVYILGRWERKV